MILPVYLYGQPVLRKEAEEVPMDYPDLKQLVANMFETMYNADGVGLAAPQVGLSLRLLVIDADVMGDDFPECKGFKRAMINPVFLEKSEEEVSMEEGCLSLPGVHEKVARSPECPNGGLPMSWARQAAETMEPISGKLTLPSGYFCIRPLATLLPNERPTQETSKLCVKRLCTNILPGRGNTCVLFCKRRKGEEKIRRS